jgi:hypothetical protein
MMEEEKMEKKKEGERDNGKGFAFWGTSIELSGDDCIVNNIDQYLN